MRRAVRFMAAALFLIGAAPFSESQANEYTILTESRLVLLDVSVQKSGGGRVGGLEKDNFQVFDNGKAMPISVFANHDVPVTVGILVDESLSMRRKRADVIAAARAFIGASNPKDEVFVVNFNENVKFGLPPDMPFSDNIKQLRTALDRGQAQGRTALYDAVIAGLKHLEQGRRDKKTLIVISDGGDNASKATRQQMLDEVSRNFATVYTIGIFDEDSSEKDPSILAKLAKMTGGISYFPATLEGMLPVCWSIAADIRTRYTIGYGPPETETGKRHKVRVVASAPGMGSLKVRTRTGYWNETARENPQGSQG